MENEKAKKYFWISLDILIIALVLNVLFFVMPAISKFGESQLPARTITVTAEGKTTAKPDIAQFSFSVVTEGVNLTEIAKENNKTIDEVVTYIKSEGISADDIKTTQYNLSPKYEYNDKTRKSFISGYTLTQSVFVKVRELEKNIDKISKILGSLPEMGINQISGVSFTVEDPESYLVDARADAFKKARAKAEAMAKATGVSLGRVMNVGEYQNGPIPYYAMESAKFGMGGAPSIASPAPLEPGTQEINVNVNVTYALR